MAGQAYNQHTTTKPETMKLLNVQIFFRHGARTPLNYFEGIEEVEYDKTIHGAPVPEAEVPFQIVDIDSGEMIPNLSPEKLAYTRLFKGGMYAGMLTATGKKQVFKLGHKLKQHYIDELGFISPQFNKDEVYVRSSNIKRTLESLQCLIGGMFGTEQFKENGPLIIPVKHYQCEDLIPNARNCKTLQQISQNMVESLINNSQYRKVLSKVQQITGRDGYIDLVQLYDHITSRKVHGLKLEQWMIDMEKDITKAAIAGVHFYIAGDQQYWHVTRPLAIGKVYQMIEDNMKAAIKSESSTPKLHLYSCHDTTIFPLMMVLGDPMECWPPFAADIRFELYEDERKCHWVKVIFCEKEYIPEGCKGPLVAFTKFQDIIKHVKLTPEEYSLLCSDIDAAKELVKMIYGVEKENNQ